MPLVSPRIFGCEWELCEASDAGGCLSEENTIQVDIYWFQDSRTLGGVTYAGKIEAMHYIRFLSRLWLGALVQSPLSILDADKLHADPPQQSQRETKGGIAGILSLLVLLII